MSGRDFDAALVGSTLTLAILTLAAGSWIGTAGFLLLAAISAGLWRSSKPRPIGHRVVCNCGWVSSFYPNPEDARNAARAHVTLAGHPRDGAS